MSLSNEELERYSRHIILDEIGYIGQKKLKESSVLIIGAGGLGAPSAMYLAAAGVGRIGIADGDKVDLTNLQRQIIHTTSDIGRSKVESAKETILAINPNVCVETYDRFLYADNIREVIRGYDFILDGTDSFASKFLINDACVMEKKPFCHAGILRFYGQVMTILPGETVCYRCVFEDMPPKDSIPSCSEAGVIGAMAGVIGSIQALEAVKYITGAGELLTGKMLTFDALKMNFRVVPLPNRRKDCEVCSDEPTITELIDYEQPSCDLRS